MPTNAPTMPGFYTFGGERAAELVLEVYEVYDFTFTSTGSIRLDPFDLCHTGGYGLEENTYLVNNVVVDREVFLSLIHI